jgi:hypothetical protein
VTLHGPTEFAEIIKLATEVSAPYAEPEDEELKYFILLILTDGVINDMQVRGMIYSTSETDGVILTDGVINDTQVRGRFETIGIGQPILFS